MRPNFTYCGNADDPEDYEDNENFGADSWDDDDDYCDNSYDDDDDDDGWDNSNDDNDDDRWYDDGVDGVLDGVDDGFGIEYYQTYEDDF